MKLPSKTIVTLAATGLLVAGLASCGGGGSDGDAPAPTFQAVVSSVPAVTYVADTLLVSNQITSVRQGSGSGLAAQNTHLDTAAANHASFLVSNGLVSDSVYLTSNNGGVLGGHYENSALPGYTGASPQARTIQAGYSGTVTELMIFGAASGTACMDSLANSVYHLINLVSPFVDVGITFNTGTGAGSACAIELGVGTNILGQLPAAGYVVFYPYEGQTGVPPTFYNQAEVPVPAPDLASTGHPIAVSLYTLATPSLSGRDVVMNTVSITPGGGVPVAVRVLVASAAVTSSGPALTVDANIPAAGFVVLLPTLPLAANTAHTVAFSATVKGHAVSKTWSFTTGAAN